MRTQVWLAALGLALAAGLAVAGETPGYPYYYPGYSQRGQDLSIEELRKLGLTPEQIQKVAELRRDLEKERVRLDAQLKVAQQAAAAANAEVARLTQETQALTNSKLVKVYESVMNEAQLKAWNHQRFLEQAKQWLQSYKQYLKLTDAQVEDIAGLLVPVYEKYAKMEDQATAAREELSELRRAEKPDVAAIEKAEKAVAEVSKTSVWQARQTECMEKMRPGLLPDQIEKLGKMYQYQR
jgi:chromosome segregation ATPase